MGSVPVSLLRSSSWCFVCFADHCEELSRAGQFPLTDPLCNLSLADMWDRCDLFCNQSKRFLYSIPKQLLASALSFPPHPPTFFYSFLDRVMLPSDTGPQLSVKIFLVLGLSPITNGHFTFHH